ncbi:FHIP family protein AGAP011705 isoform X2 [Leptidea sinapis]|uniref:FHIP family protein AGAP011705 isoform X2 n=1 Tax=Leptidea sinapis TaxID=189913 RepID=UPI0021C28E4D|nr:FHIP family protein AGAP011705 isoform X2 [Leptidea sinapis]
MSWIKNTMVRQTSRSLDPRRDYEPQACYNSFCKHWQQAYDIILKSQPHHLHDDVFGVINHLEQLTTLLVLEARAREISSMHLSNPAACFEYLLSENLLDKLYEWGICTGKYENVVKLEQLKIFGHLINHYSSQVIAAEPFLRPLLKLLSGFRNELPPVNVECQLVTVLNQLCVALMQNMKFVDLFFLMTHTQNGSQPEFLIGRLLLSSVHREGSCGSLARDAFLLCAKMSARCDLLASCLLEGNACPILATGLSGLYSLLPRSLDENVHRLTPDDVNRVNKLTLFIDSLEFCNAVAQVAHPSIRRHLLDLLYQGFLVPVLGPALLQSGRGEQAAATAYCELVLRCATPDGLLRQVLRYLLTCRYDGVRLLDVLLSRLEGNSQVSLVTLSLIETLIDLNCEDVMIELVFKYLLNGHHIISPLKTRISDPEPYREAAVAFLSLSPKCCQRPLQATLQWAQQMSASGRKILDLKSNTDNGLVNGSNDDYIAMSNLLQNLSFDYANPNESLLGNYHAYLCDSRFEIASRSIACASWTSKYNYFISNKSDTNINVKEKDIENNATREQDSLVSICTSGYETLKTSDTSDKEPHSLNSLIDGADKNYEETKELDSLSFESSGYDSFKYKDYCELSDTVYSEDSFRKCFEKSQDSVGDIEMPLRSYRIGAETMIGPLLCSLLKKTSLLLEADVTSHCHVTGVISKLCALSAPILSSLLLCPTLVTGHNVPSLYQILNQLRQEVDMLLESSDRVEQLVDEARVFLIRREMALVRRPVHELGRTRNSNTQQTESNSFDRSDSKRRSFSSSFTSIFAKKVPPTTQLIPINQPKLPAFTQESYWNQSVTLRAVLNAVLLDEWLKELSALCQEHALRLAAQNYEDDTYIRTIAL